MKKWLLLPALLAGLATGSSAHEGHKHEAAVEEPPHGGLLRDAEPFKSEVVIEGDKVTLYIYDKALKPVALDKNTIEGKAQLPRKKPKRVEFTRSGDAYTATIPGIGKVHRFDLHVMLEVGDVKALADFGIDNIQ